MYVHKNIVWFNVGVMKVCASIKYFDNLISNKSRGHVDVGFMVLHMLYTT